MSDANVIQFPAITPEARAVVEFMTMAYCHDHGIDWVNSTPEDEAANPPEKLIAWAAGPGFPKLDRFGLQVFKTGTGMKWRLEVGSDAEEAVQKIIAVNAEERADEEAA